MDEEGAVGRGVHIEFYRICAPRPGRPEGRPRVFVFVSRRAPVRDDQRLAHFAKLSAFLGSIQPGSFSMACTVA